MSTFPRPDQLIWVTRTCAINPAQILEVFRGKGGHLEVYFVGRTLQLSEPELTDAGRALLLPAERPGEVDDHHLVGS